ncbi:MAG: hypothetical protein QOG11_1233, partial [Solirubrobacteraceae bacterium]|nr:hypothetical protein [Solirubrobacteraceae bacterium]
MPDARPSAPDVPHAHEDLWDEDPYDDLPAEDEELPPRPRRRLITPVTGVLAAVVIAGGGFIGGVELQKHQGTSGGGAGPTAAAGLRPGGAGAAGAGGGGAPGGAGGGAAPGGAGGGAQPTTGTVVSTSGSVIYVKDASGTTVKVKTTSASKV